jgi:uncharacterized protein (TIGR00369 family)
MEFVRRWIEKSPYSAALGVRLEAISGDAARLHLPYKDENSNPGRALHGGCAASLAALGAQAVTRAALGPESGPWHSFGLQINYLSAAIAEDVVAEARLLRRGKELCFVEVDVATGEGKAIAHATAGVRGRFGGEPLVPIAAAGDDGAADPGKMGPHIGRTPFMGKLGIEVQHMRDARSRLVMPFREGNADEEGGVHEGAALALFDSTGAMASWAETGPGRFKASTPSVQAQILRPPPRDDLVAYAHVVQRDGELFWSDVEMAGASDGRLVARGTVIYRIVT